MKSSLLTILELTKYDPNEPRDPKGQWTSGNAQEALNLNGWNQKKSGEYVGPEGHKIKLETNGEWEHVQSGPYVGHYIHMGIGGLHPGSTALQVPNKAHMKLEQHLRNLGESKHIDKITNFGYDDVSLGPFDSHAEATALANKLSKVIGTDKYYEDYYGHSPEVQTYIHEDQTDEMSKWAKENERVLVPMDAVAPDYKSKPISVAKGMGLKSLENHLYNFGLHHKTKL